MTKEQEALATPTLPVQEPTELANFKNFHRSLCARFNYTHDEKFWWRDLVSLEEHIAKTLPVQRQPLTDEQFNDLVMEHLGPHALTGGKMSVYDAFLKAVRATEAAHNIGVNK